MAGPAASEHGQALPLLEWDALTEASEFGKESALFFPTGVCAQLAALCVYAGGVGRGAGDLMPRLSRPSFIVQATSHLLLHEDDAARQLLGFTPLVVGAKDRPLSPADVEKER